MPALEVQVAEIILDCPHCHVRKVGFEGVGGRVRPSTRDNIGSERVWDALFCCRHCERGVVVSLKGYGSGVPPFAPGGNPMKEHVLVGLVPKLTVVRAPRHVPQSVAESFIEATTTLRAGQPVPSAIMCRRALEQAMLAIAKLKDIDIGRHTPLAGKIEAVAARTNLLPETMQRVAASIRLGGNAAAHGTEDITELEATRLWNFTRLFLTYVFTLPEDLSNFENPPRTL